MFGIMSASHNREIAAKFMDEHNYMFVIHIPNIRINKIDHRFDHGFVDSSDVPFS